MARLRSVRVTSYELYQTQYVTIGGQTKLVEDPRDIGVAKFEKKNLIVIDRSKLIYKMTGEYNPKRNNEKFILWTITGELGVSLLEK